MPKLSLWWSYDETGRYLKLKPGGHKEFCIADEVWDRYQRAWAELEAAEEQLEEAMSQAGHPVAPGQAPRLEVE